MRTTDSSPETISKECVYGCPRRCDTLSISAACPGRRRGWQRDRIGDLTQILRGSISQLAPDGHETPRGHMQARSIETNLPSLFLAASVVFVLVAWVVVLVYVGVRYI
jgi:hypothetical protein